MTVRSNGDGGPLGCHDCGHDYAYIGVDPHPGYCPACGSRAVSPAGAVRLHRHDLEAAAPPGGEVHVTATDESGRDFRYGFRLLDRHHATLVSVRVAGRPVRRPPQGWSTDLLPPVVREVLDENGLSSTGAAESLD
ncbi:hypothetical protein [Halomarina ordinaria]|uniref:DUF35 domain-containing protein n=1 Tax=Halomarina ordinaria TaxID=3033939 RepID=A0ABD5UG39_9EURY|nr:hypothetical protein [Halomarina sp. PSRA2]